MSDESKSVWKLAVGSLSKLLREKVTEDGEQPLSAENTSSLSEVTSKEGYLRVASREDELDFFSTANSDKMFSLKAKLAGPLAKFTQGDAASGRKVILRAPLELPCGDKAEVKITFHVPNQQVPLGQAKVIHAIQALVPPETRLLDMQYSREKCDLRYAIELPSKVEVSSFKEVLDKRPVFQTIPPVVQMSAFLRAITRKRRTAVNILESLTSIASPESLPTMTLISKKCQEGSLVLPDETSLKIKELIRQSNRIISEHVITAFSLFVDIEAGVINEEYVNKFAELNILPISTWLVSRHFGLDISSPDVWHSLYPQTKLEDIQKQAAKPKYADVIKKFSGKLDNRSSMQILEQIAKDSNSQKVASFAAKLKETIKDGSLSMNDQQLALLAVLSAVGRRYHANTVLALCLFVDAEVGYIDEGDLDELNVAQGNISTSTYAMLSVAGAFDVNLLGLVIEETAGEDLNVCFPKLVELANVGLLAGFYKKQDEAMAWHWIRSGQAASQALAKMGAKFAKTILGALPIIDQLSELDFVNMLDSGRDFIAAFQSDFDKTILWRRLSDISQDEFRTAPSENGKRTSFSFIQGFSAYHFSRAVVGRLEDVEEKDLIGQKDVLTIFLDSRENRHYRYIAQVNSPEDLEPPKGSGLVWGGKIVPFIDVSLLPGKIRELGKETLLGNDIENSAEYKKLSWINDALVDILLKKPEYHSLTLYPDLWERLYNRIWSPQNSQVLASLMDQRTLEILHTSMQSKNKVLDIALYAPVLSESASDDLLDYVGLEIISQLCISEALDFEGYFKHVNDLALHNLLSQRLLKLAASDIDENRVLAMRLMSTLDFVPDANSKMVAEYELTRGLADQTASVGKAASEGLVRLCLNNSVPLPNMMRATRIQRETTKEIQAEKVQEEPEVPQDTNGIDPLEIKALEREIDSWLKGLKQNQPKRYKTLPFVDENGQISRSHLRSFIELLAALNQASKDEDGLLPRRYFSLVSNRKLEEVRSALFDSWKMMAASQNKSLAQIVAETPPAEVFLDYRFFLEDNDENLRQKLGTVPYLGGPLAPLSIYHFKPDEEIGPYIRVESSFIQSEKQESRFFQDLMSMYFETPEGRVRVLRLHSAGGMRMEELESFLPVFETSRTIDLRFAEVFQSHRIRFYPLIHDMAFNIEQVGSAPEDIIELEALLSLFRGQRKPVNSSLPSGAKENKPAKSTQPPEKEDKKDTGESEKQKTDTKEPKESIDAKEIEPEVEEEEEEEETNHNTSSPYAESLSISRFTEIAAVLREYFGCPPEMDRQIVNMLMITARRSSYDI